jgi:hypothetical protein
MIRRLLRPLHRFARSLRLFHWTRVVLGCAGFVWRGRTPAFAYQSLVSLFCMSGGRSNDRLSRLISRVAPPYRFPGSQGVLGRLSQSEIGSITERLDRDGYYLFPTRLPEETCRRLTNYALTTPASILAGEGTPPMTDVRVPYGPERAAPRGVRYELAMSDVVANPDVQALLCDLSILSVAQSYLRARPVADVLAIWWTTAFNAQPSAAAAQYFHFDMDRIKWLKFFIYLTDVGPETGPHVFVAGSHRTGSIPQNLLDRGYARLPDDDVRACFSETNLVEFNAPRGAILAEDTRGLHKGKHVMRGDRLMLQLQFSNSLFGGTYPPSQFGQVIPDLASAARQFPAIYESFSERAL